jgi:putative Mn2+ efflux pump MntP
MEYRMDIITLLFIAIGLATDAFAVSVSTGITIKHKRINHALRVALSFGSFQALMPLIGWSAGTT